MVNEIIEILNAVIENDRNAIEMLTQPEKINALIDTTETCISILNTFGDVENLVGAIELWLEDIDISVNLRKYDLSLFDENLAIFNRLIAIIEMIDCLEHEED